ncbi:MAG: hypothetical protein II648_00080 [Bacteroidales bacterium]|jgi:hypothetical protein|nr:hypothetical protein [Bacteroidales bacterium]
MKQQLLNLMGKGAYLPPTTESIVVLYTKKVICASGYEPSSTTEVWEEEDLSML